MHFLWVSWVDDFTWITLTKMFAQIKGNLFSPPPHPKSESDEDGDEDGDMQVTWGINYS